MSPAPTSPSAGNTYLTGETPTVDTVLGFWRVDNHGVVLRFARPNLIWLDDDGQILHAPDVRATYEVVGNQIAITAVDGPAGCAGRTFDLEASLLEPGLMRFTYTREGADRQWILIPHGDR